MLSIVVMLLNRDRISARELAEKFEVNIRTIYRDIDAINLAGIPVISYPGNNGGFGIMQNFRLERQLLSLADLSSILAALKSINTSLENVQIDNAIEKLQNLVPQNSKSYFNDSFEQIAIDLIPWGVTSKVRDNLKILYDAVTRRQLISAVYRAPQKPVETRTIEPMTLLVKGFAWYLFGYCRNRRAFRIFKVSRMREIEILAGGFERRDESYRNHLSYLPEEQHVPVKAVLRFCAELKDRIEETWDESQIRENHDGTVDVTVEFPDEVWITPMILSYGSGVEVISPESLRERIALSAQQTVNVYRKSN